MNKFIGIIVSIVIIGAAVYWGWMVVYPEDTEVPLPVEGNSKGAIDSATLPLATSAQESVPMQKIMLQLTSTTFENGDRIPAKYTCDGANINPPLAISGVPEGTRALTLIMDDHDVPRSVHADGVWDHWVVFNIPPATTFVGEGTKAPGTYGIGTNKKASYLGPCPPDREHRYSFRLYALDTVLDLSLGATKEQILSAMSGHILAETELMGRYERR